MTCKNCECENCPDDCNCENCPDDCNCENCTPETCDCKKSQPQPQDDFGYRKKMNGGPHSYPPAIYQYLRQFRI